MKFIIGLLAGTALGGYLFNTMTEEQRSSVQDRVRTSAQRAKNSTLGTTISDNASKVSDAAEQQAADAVDRAGDAAVGSTMSDQT